MGVKGSLIENITCETLAQRIENNERVDNGDIW